MMDARAPARLVFTLAATLSAVSVSTAQAQSHKTVLTIHSGAENYPANPVLDEGIRQALGSRRDLAIDYFAEYLESDLFPGRRAELAFRDYIRRKYAGRRIDAVITITLPALQFALARRRELFPGAPLIFAGAVPDEVVRRSRGVVTGMRVGNAWAETLKLALALHPGTQRVFVVAKGPAEQVALVRAELREFESRVGLTYVSEESVAALLRVVRGVPPRSVVLYVWHSQEEAGHIQYPNEIVPLVAGAAPVPVYGSSDLYVGSGVVGGVVRGTRATGVRLGELALRVLGGTPTRNIPIEMPRLVTIVDWRQLRRWDIDPSRLPSGTDVRFRVPTMWESYRPYVIGAVTVVIAQLLLIAALFSQRERLRRAEHVVRAREVKLQFSYDRIRQLNARIVTAQEVARAEIANELHDDVCQQLVAVSIGVGELRHSSGHLQEAQAQRTLTQLHETLRRLVEGVRRLSHDLHPATLRLVGLAAALRSHCVEVEERHDVQVRFENEGSLEDLNPDVALSLYRIAQEALRNGAVHGDARRLVVAITRSTDDIEMTIRDDGKGFDLDAVRHEGRGLGLVSMEERARAVGGNVAIASRPGFGTTVRVRLRTNPEVHVDRADVYQSA